MGVRGPVQWYPGAVGKTGPGTESFGRYRLHRRFALGGMAELFLAEQRSAADVWRLVVIKRLLPHFAEDAAYCTMFLDEARIASRLSHPNIVQILDFGEIEGEHFIAMEYLAGETLRAVMNQCQRAGVRLPVWVALEVLTAACDGLHYAHELSEGGAPLRVVHRDVSPANLMLTYQGQVKILDFGIARAEIRVQERTETGVAKGKLGYIPPEQYAGEELDRRADIWALGVVAFEALTGVHPFRRENEEATLRALLYDAIPSLTSIRPDLDPDVDVVIGRALERDPRRRYPTAHAFRLMLERLDPGALTPGDPGRLDEYMHALFGDDQARARTAVRDEISQSRSRPTVPIAVPAVETAVSSAPRPVVVYEEPRRRSPLAVTGVVVAALLLVLAVALGVARIVGRAVEPDDRFDRGMALAQAGQLAAAEPLLRTYVEAHPDHADAHIALALVDWWADGDALAQELERVRAIPLDEAQRGLVEALALEADGAHASAIATLEPLVDRYPDRADLLVVLGEARWHAGDVEAGSRTLLAAFDADPRWLMALRHPVDLELDRRGWPVLEPLAARVGEVDPASGAVLRARIAMGQRAYGEALAILEEAADQSPDAPAVWLVMAQAAALAGEMARGEEAARRAVELEASGGVEAAAQLAEYALYRGDLERFVQAADPSSPGSGLARLLWQGRAADGPAPAPSAACPSSPLSAAVALEVDLLGGGPPSRSCPTPAAGEVRALGEGLALQAAGEGDRAAEAYRRALEAPQGGEVRMLAAYDLARLLRGAGDAEGAAAACDEVLHPRVYRPYRGVLLPDCLLWSAEPAQPLMRTMLLRQLTESWTGGFEHPAVVEARERLAGTKPRAPDPEG